MNWQNELQSALDSMVSAPKTTIVVSTFSTAAGVARFEQWITGVGSTLAVFAGLIGVIVLARLNLIKSKNEKIRGRILREKALSIGIDPDDDE